MRAITNKLIIFVKAPVPGKVKTRLVPPLSYEQAAEIYKGWAREIFNTASCLNSVSVEIAYESHPDFPNPGWIWEHKSHISPPFFLQEGKNLGERLIHAFHHAFEQAAEKVVIIGSDSPGLPLDYLSLAFEQLEQNDIVLGPTQDGGYYLIGLRNCVLPELFENVSWSTEQVFSQTITNAKKLNLKCSELPEYFDIDTAEDLKNRLLNSVEKVFQ